MLIKQKYPNANVVGIDGDPSILAIASRKMTEAGASIQFDHGLSWYLPYPDGYFDRILSSLFFHHLSWQNKLRTAREVRRVLRPGGELHVADWGEPSNLLMRVAFVTVQLLDGFENTRDNVNGRLLKVFAEAQLVDVTQKRTYDTVLGTLALYRAVKP